MNFATFSNNCVTINGKELRNLAVRISFMYHEIAMIKKSQTEMNWNEVEICEANISLGY